MVYGNPFQITRMVQVYNYATGEGLESICQGFAGTCVGGFLFTRHKNKPQIVLPGYGDRALARVEDHEMAFPLPWTIWRPCARGSRTRGSAPASPGHPTNIPYATWIFPSSIPHTWNTRGTWNGSKDPRQRYYHDRATKNRQKIGSGNDILHFPGRRMSEERVTPRNLTSRLLIYRSLRLTLLKRPSRPDALTSEHCRRYHGCGPSPDVTVPELGGV